MWDADDIQDDQHNNFHCVNPFLSAENAHLFPQTGAHEVSTFLSQNNDNKLCFILHELIAFYEQTSSCTSD
jgi:hypothetical protein